MKNTNTFGIQFFGRTNKLRNNVVPIYCRITVNGQRVELSLKQSIDVRYWNDEKGAVKGHRPEIKSLNLYLEGVRTKFFNYYQEMQLKKEIITAEAIKNKFLGVGCAEHTLCSAIRYHNIEMKDSIAYGTLKNYFTTERYIHKFLKERYNSSDLYLSQLTFKFITEFEAYLRSYKPKDHQKPLNNNGVMKHLERFRKIIRMAIRMEWIEKDPFAAFKQKFDKVERGFLTKDELKRLEEKQLKLERLQLVRDLFVFSCYTGLAYIDVMNLKPLNLTIGFDNAKWIRTSRQKNTNPVLIPLLPKASIIIEKYEDHPRSQEKGTLFPNISNQKVNSYLDEIADLCDIEKHLTFHLARHTFATTVTLTNGVPIESVSKMLGHSKITTTQIYAHVIEKKLSEDMSNLREKLAAQNV